MADIKEVLMGDTFADSETVLEVLAETLESCEGAIKRVLERMWQIRQRNVVEHHYDNLYIGVIVTEETDHGLMVICCEPFRIDDEMWNKLCPILVEGLLGAEGLHAYPNFSQEQVAVLAGVLYKFLSELPDDPSNLVFTSSNVAITSLAHLMAIANKCYYDQLKLPPHPRDVGLIINVRVFNERGKIGIMTSSVLLRMSLVQKPN